MAAIKALLDTLVLKGCIVTMDPLGCQTDVAEKIVDQGGDYVLAVKDNQKNLPQAVVEFFDTAEAFAFRNIDVKKRTTVEKNHGRIETRRAVFVGDVSWVDTPMRTDWNQRNRPASRHTVGIVRYGGVYQTAGVGKFVRPFTACRRRRDTRARPSSMVILPGERSSSGDGMSGMIVTGIRADDTPVACTPTPRSVSVRGTPS